MFSRLRGLIRADGEGPENRERREEADAQFGRKAGRNKWFWQRRSESWAGGGQLAGRGGFEVGLPVMG